MNPKGNCKYVIDISPHRPLCDHPFMMTGGGPSSAECDGCEWYESEEWIRRPVDLNGKPVHVGDEKELFSQMRVNYMMVPEGEPCVGTVVGICEDNIVLVESPTWNVERGIRSDAYQRINARWLSDVND